MLEKIKNFNFSDPKNLALLACVLGILFVIFPTGLLTALMWVIGLVAVVFGLFHVIGYFTNDGHEIGNRLVIGLSFTAAGLYFIINSALLQNMASTIFGIVIILFSFYLVQYAFELKKADFKNWSLVLVAACVLAVLAVILLFHVFGASVKARMIFTGISLIIAGLAQVFCDLLLNRAGFDREKVKKDGIVINEQLFTSTFEGVKNTINEVVEKVNEKQAEVEEATEEVAEATTEVEETATKTADEITEAVEEITEE